MSSGPMTKSSRQEDSGDGEPASHHQPTKNSVVERVTIEPNRPWLNDASEHRCGAVRHMSPVEEPHQANAEKQDGQQQSNEDQIGREYRRLRKPTACP